MLQEVRNSAFTRRLTLFGWRYQIVIGKQPSAVSWPTTRYRGLQAAQQTQPSRLMAAKGKTYWWFQDRVFWDNEDLDAEDILALIRERDRRKQRKLERARANMAAESSGVPRRETMPREVKLAVFERDGGRCVECGSGFEIQYDHIIPFAMGGASTVENLQILCADCNRRKGATIA
jgi:hypothetical protein